MQNHVFLTVGVVFWIASCVPGYSLSLQNRAALNYTGDRRLALAKLTSRKFEVHCIVWAMAFGMATALQNFPLDVGKNAQNLGLESLWAALVAGIIGMLSICFCAYLFMGTTDDEARKQSVLNNPLSTIFFCFIGASIFWTGHSLVRWMKGDLVGKSVETNQLNSAIALVLGIISVFSTILGAWKRLREPLSPEK